MNKNKSSLDYVIYALFILIIVALVYLLFFNKNRYQKMEDRMVEAAEEYVNSNNISVSKEIYFDVSKLNITLDDDCSLLSGVIYNGSIYTPYLSCKNYKTNVIPNNKEAKEYIELKGDEVIVITKGMNFYDPGYVSNDVINRTGNIGTEEGVYTLYYRTNNSNQVAIRKVIIIDNNNLKSLFPTINLKGEKIVYIVQNGNYVDQGAEANDSVDGNLTSEIIVDGNVNSKVLDEYKINYVVTNSRGYTNSVSRIVGVVPRESDLVVKYSLYPENLTNQDVKIKLSLSDEYQKIIYPDGSEGQSLEYEVTINGNYRFKVFDKYGRDIVQVVEVTNIDKTLPVGTCKAVTFYDRTEVKVTISTKNTISSYEYNLDGNIVTSQADSISSQILKPSSVKVKVKDIINNQSEITCTIEKAPVPEIVTNAKGKNCLEGYTCYIQFEWGSRQYPFCSMSNNPNSCGGIGSNGCSITSATNAIAAMKVKSKNGTLHTPWTVYDELYPINKKTGECGGGCSGWERIRDSIVNAGLTAPEKVTNLTRNTLPDIIKNLQQGYPVVIYAQGRPFSSGKAHYLALLAVRDDGYVFLTDSANESGINKATYNGKPYYVDTWIDPNDLITGNVKQFLLVGPPGLYKGKLR